MKHECLAYASSPGSTANAWCFVRGEETYKVSPKHRLRVNDAKALLTAALEGFGIAFIAEDLARENLRSGRLIKVLPDYETPSHPIHVIYHPDRRQTPKLKSFIDAVVSELSS
jgi:DNA-binding transcriptional LysR family regulator